MDRLKNKKIYLLDMDGTIYLGNQLIKGAKELIWYFQSKHIEYVFMTNNSSKSKAEYVKKLCNLGIDAKEENVFTSGQAAALYLAKMKKSAVLYVVGTAALKKELTNFGFTILIGKEKPADFVLVGYDTELTYEKLTMACAHLCEGAGFFATNPDVVCPAEGGRFLPDCATMCDMLRAATGKEPFYIGKPRSEMPLGILKERGIAPEFAVIVGDRLYTDIACGKNACIDTVLVLSGETTAEMARSSSIKAEITVKGIWDILALYQNMEQSHHNQKK